MTWSALGADLELQVDFRDAPRHLIKADLRFDVQPGSLVLWYPKWAPGAHSPFGPIQNFIGMRVETAMGKAVAWRRETANPYRFLLDVPEGAKRLQIQMRYVANESAPGFEGTDAVANYSLGYFNWNTCLLYPEQADLDEFSVKPTLVLPKAWQARSALSVEATEANEVVYAPVSLRRLVDSPVMVGEHVRTILLTEEGEAPPHYLHVAGRESRHTHPPREVIDGYRRLVREAYALFSSRPFDAYHFLLIFDDDLEPIGMEHQRSSLNLISPSEFWSPRARVGWNSELLPHEFAHAWCGKFRRPVGMKTDFHNAKQLELLWVYEGLTEYLGAVLTVRSGLMTQEQFQQAFADRLNMMLQHKGRRWQSLEDTAVTGFLRRESSYRQMYLRRDQDFYDEGMLLWMEADARIRELTQGKKSLDDFCRAFFGREAKSTYTEDELYVALDAVVPYDWRDFFQSRVRRINERLPLEFLLLIGYEWKYVASPSAYQETQEGLMEYLDETTGMGLLIGSEGEVLAVIEGSPADKAKLGEGDRIAMVNGKSFDFATFRKRIVGKESISLKIRRGPRFHIVALRVDPDRRFPAMVRDLSRADRLADILRSTAKR